VLHDLLREYARALAAADGTAETRTAAGRLLNYYAHVAAATSRHIATWTKRADACRCRPGRGSPRAAAAR
jgi:hypothetical protein